MRAILIAAAILIMAAAPAISGSVAPREGWRVHDTDQSYAALLENTRAAIKAEGMFLVTEAGPTQAAANRGIDIPGNRVLGVYRNDYAVRALRLSVPAMIEAPIRLYVTQDDDGTATLSYKTPTHVFGPYMAEGGPKLEALAEELDQMFAAIADRAVSSE
jgi:uncharacterized protein (DUF302 family)